jgi:hypothetical protein
MRPKGGGVELFYGLYGGPKEGDTIGRLRIRREKEDAVAFYPESAWLLAVHGAVVKHFGELLQKELTGKALAYL